MSEENILLVEAMNECTAINYSQHLLQLPFQIISNNFEQNELGTVSSTSPAHNKANETTYDNKVVWLEPAIKLLVSLVEEYRPKLGKSIKFKTKKKMWEVIEETMRLHKYEYNASQIENKWKSLERSYKNKTQHNKKTGRDRASCSYEKELNNVFRGRDNIFPQYVLGVTGTGKTQKELQKEAGVEDENLETHVEINNPWEPQNTDETYPESESPVNSKSPSQVQHKKENKSMIKEISLLRQERREYYKSKIDFQSKKMDAYDQRTKEIAEKNKLLKELINIMHKQ